MALPERGEWRDSPVRFDHDSVLSNGADGLRPFAGSKHDSHRVGQGFFIDMLDSNKLDGSTQHKRNSSMETLQQLESAPLTNLATPKAVPVKMASFRQRQSPRGAHGRQG